MTTLLAVCLALALPPALVFAANLGAYRPPPRGNGVPECCKAGGGGKAPRRRRSALPGFLD